MKLYALSKIYSNLLIISSLLLLLGFLCYWNFQNYQNEKSDLIREMNYQMQLASSEVRDSALWRLIEVSLGDKDLKTVVWDSSSFIHKITENKISDSLDSADYLSIRLGGVIDDLDSRTIYSNSQHKNNSFSNHILHHTDSLDIIINDIFSKKLVEHDLPSDFEKLANPLSSTQENGFVIHFDKGRFSENRSVAVFENITGHVLKNIFPSILASLLLFGLVSVSFFVLVQSWKNQEKLVHIKNEFVSNMTHELKTPISTVGLALEAMTDFGVLENPVKTKEYIEISKHEINRLSMLVERVLKMSVFEKGEVKMKPEILDLRELLSQYLMSMHLYFEKKQCNHTYTTTGDKFLVSADKIHLTNVINNLIENAIKYSGDKPEFSILLKEKATTIVLEIKDHGIGIPSEYIDKIFEKFFRVPNQDHHNVKGHGLGLNYVKQIVQLHNGKINVKSEKNKGSLFTIELPKI